MLVWLGQHLKRQLPSLALCLAYLVAHVIGYVLMIYPWFAYRQFGLRMIDPKWIPGIVLLCLAPGLYLPFRRDRPSDIAGWFFYCCLVMPGCYISFLSLNRPVEEIFGFGWLLVISLGLIEVGRRLPIQFKFKQVLSSDWVPGFLLPAVAILAALALFAANGLQFDISYATIYERRLAARSFAGPGMMLGLVSGLLVKVFVPMLAIFATLWRSRTLWAVCIACTLISWSVDALKTVLFLPVLVLGLSYMARAKNPTVWFVSLMGVGILAVTALSLSPFSNLAMEIANATFKRQAYSPGLLTAQYWDWFVDNPKNFLANRQFFDFFGDSPYQGSIARWMGSTYYGQPDVNANTGIMGSGYAEFGVVGMLVASALAGLFLRWFDALSEQRDQTLGFIFVVLICVEWTNRALQTSLVSGGVLALAILLWLYSPPQAAPAFEPEPVAA